MGLARQYKFNGIRNVLSHQIVIAFVHVFGTIHIAIEEVPRALTPTLLERTIRITEAALRRDFGIAAQPDQILLTHGATQALDIQPEEEGDRLRVVEPSPMALPVTAG